MPYETNTVSTGHLIHGWTMTDPTGVTADDVFVRCDEMAHIPAAALEWVHRENRALPPLDSCGWHHAGL